MSRYRTLFCGFGVHFVHVELSRPNITSSVKFCSNMVQLGDHVGNGGLALVTCPRSQNSKFKIAENAVTDDPNLNVVIVKRLPRFDRSSKDILGIKSQLSNFSNHVYDQLWLKKGSHERIHIIDNVVNMLTDLCNLDMLNSRG